jgi:hypothetical protein
LRGQFLRNAKVARGRQVARFEARVADARELIAKVRGHPPARWLLPSRIDAQCAFGVQFKNPMNRIRAMWNYALFIPAVLSLVFLSLDT